MNDGDALLAAILANPDDDTPRLVYADWLQERGDEERAEFIRIQCAIAVREDEVAENRATELTDRNRGKWLAGLPQFAEVQWDFRRGFPEVLTVEGDVFLQRYAAFTGLTWPCCLSLYYLGDAHVRDLVSREWNPRWVELELQEHPMAGVFYYGSESSQAFAAIANCPQARQLRKLQFSLFALTSTAVEALARSPYLDHLEQLRLEGDVNSPGFAPLRERFRDRLVAL
jgi:uncharacterized protein (TIGR02996 family)